VEGLMAPLRHCRFFNSIIARYSSVIFLIPLSIDFDKG
jgi:hypothetical protein